MSQPTEHEHGWRPCANCPTPPNQGCACAGDPCCAEILTDEYWENVE